MLLRRCLIVLLAAMGLWACSTPVASDEDIASKQVVRGYDLEGFTFKVANGLVVSEAETFYPNADIVWRGDPFGPRLPQIRAMFQTAYLRNEAVLDVGTPVAVQVTLLRFHGVTEKTRYTIGGVYNIIFELTVKNASTGELIESGRIVTANLDAPGGIRAVELDRSGQTQKVRVTDFLSKVLRQELL